MVYWFTVHSYWFSIALYHRGLVRLNSISRHVCNLEKLFFQVDTNADRIYLITKKSWTKYGIDNDQFEDLYIVECRMESRIRTSGQWKKLGNYNH